MPEMLSQKDIDAMLAVTAGGQATQPAPSLSAIEIDTLGEIGNISMGSAATALYTILGRKVTITTPKVETTTLEKLADGHEIPYLVVNVGYTEGFAGNNLFILKLEDVKVITDIMMGGDGHPDLAQELDEIHISAISEAMNQMMGGMSTAMADMFERKINITPPTSIIVRLSDQQMREIFQTRERDLIGISFKMEIEGLVDSKIMQLMPLSFGRELARNLSGSPHQQQAAPPAEKPEAAKTRPQPAPGPAQPRMQPAVDVRPIQLTSFDEPDERIAMADGGIDLILDVPLLITVELGQCKKTIKDVLELGLGSIITLDKQAGEPVDVVANGKPVAKGEVIVVDDSYGIRITEVLSNTRLRLQK